MNDTAPAAAAYRITDPQTLSKGVSLLCFGWVFSWLALYEIPAWIGSVFLLSYACAYVRSSIRFGDEGPGSPEWLLIPIGGAAMCVSTGAVWGVGTNGLSREMMALHPAGSLLIAIAILATMGRLRRLMRAMNRQKIADHWSFLMSMVRLIALGPIVTLLSLAAGTPVEHLRHVPSTDETPPASAEGVSVFTNALLLAAVVLALVLVVVIVITLYKAFAGTRAAIREHVTAETPESAEAIEDIA